MFIPYSRFRARGSNFDTTCSPDISADILTGGSFLERSDAFIDGRTEQCLESDLVVTWMWDAEDVLVERDLLLKRNGLVS